MAPGRPTECSSVRGLLRKAIRTRHIRTELRSSRLSLHTSHNWESSFAPSFAFGEGRSKDKQLHWFSKLSPIRNRVAHPERSPVTEEELDCIQALLDHFDSIQPQLPPRGSDLVSGTTDARLGHHVRRGVGQPPACATRPAGGAPQRRHAADGRRGEHDFLDRVVTRGGRHRRLPAGATRSNSLGLAARRSSGALVQSDIVSRRLARSTRRSYFANLLIPLIAIDLLGKVTPL